MADYHYGVPGATYYAKPEPLDTSPWNGDVILGVENGSTGSFAFTGLDPAITYAVFRQISGVQDSGDTLSGWFASDYMLENVDELAAVPAATSSLKDKLTWLFMLARNKLTQSGSAQTAYADDDTAEVGASLTTSSGGTVTRSKFT